MVRPSVLRVLSGRTSARTTSLSPSWWAERLICDDVGLFLIGQPVFGGSEERKDNHHFREVDREDTPMFLNFAQEMVQGELTAP